MSAPGNGVPKLSVVSRDGLSVLYTRLLWLLLRTHEQITDAYCVVVARRSQDNKKAAGEFHID